MQKAIRLGLAVDETLSVSSIGAYISYPTAGHWLSDDKGAGTIDLSQPQVEKTHQSAAMLRPRVRSATPCHRSSIAETLHDVAEEAIGSAATAVGRLHPEGALPWFWPWPWPWPWPSPSPSP